MDSETFIYCRTCSNLNRYKRKLCITKVSLANLQKQQKEKEQYQRKIKRKGKYEKIEKGQE